MPTASITASGDRHAFLWTASDGMIELGTLGGTQSQATAINEQGLIVGASYNVSPMTDGRAFVRFPGGGLVRVGDDAHGGSIIWEVNAMGLVVGEQRPVMARRAPL